VLNDARSLRAGGAGNVADQQHVGRGGDDELQRHRQVRLDAMASGEIVEPDDPHQLVRHGARAGRRAACFIDRRGQSRRAPWQA
jgi:hypothetical protein